MLKSQEKNKIQVSFLQILRKQLGIESIPEPTVESWGYSLELTSKAGDDYRCICFFIENLKRVDFFLKELPVLIQPEDLILVAFAPSGKSLLFKRYYQWGKMPRKFRDLNYSMGNLFAVFPSPWETHILFDLQKNILGYVEGVSFRHSDNLFKLSIKNLLIKVLGSHSWQGWMVACLSAVNKLSLPWEIADHYMFLTPDRVVSLVFEKGKSTPAFVEKRGPSVSLQNEWENHKWAKIKLLSSVPAIYDFSTSEAAARLKIEYIPERNMVNVVAQSMFCKGKLKTETIAVLDFFHFVFGRFVGDQSIQKQPLPESIDTVTQQGLDYLYDSINADSDRTLLDKALRGKMFPLIPQHGDFCVRNILYRDSGEKVLIDWEDSEQFMLPSIDLNMLRVSLADSWTGFFDEGAFAYHKSSTVKHKFVEVEDIIRKRLNMNDSEWRQCSLLSLAYLAGINVGKGREATAARIREEFRRQIGCGSVL